MTKKVEVGMRFKHIIDGTVAVIDTIETKMLPTGIYNGRIGKVAFVECAIMMFTPANGGPFVSFMPLDQLQNSVGWIPIEE